MNYSDAETIATIAVDLSKRRPDLHAAGVALDACHLYRIGGKCAAYATALCNGTIDQATYDLRQERHRKAADEILVEYRLKACVGGDPRGYCLWLEPTDGVPLRSNSFSGEGYGIR